MIEVDQRRLLVQLAPRILQDLFGPGQRRAQLFGLGNILHGHQDTADACGMRVDSPGQHQPPLFAHDMATLQRFARTCHSMKLLQHMGFRQQKEHLGCRHSGRAHRPQPMQAACGRIGGKQPQLRALQMETQQSHRNRVQHGLEAGLYRQHGCGVCGQDGQLWPY